MRKINVLPVTTAAPATRLSLAAPVWAISGERDAAISRQIGIVRIPDRVHRIVDGGAAVQFVLNGEAWSAPHPVSTAAALLHLRCRLRRFLRVNVITPLWALVARKLKSVTASLPIGVPQ